MPSATQRLAAVTVLRERESQISPIQRIAVVDAAARWLGEDAGEELARALLEAVCSEAHERQLRRTSPSSSRPGCSRDQTDQARVPRPAGPGQVRPGFRPAHRRARLPDARRSGLTDLGAVHERAAAHRLRSRRHVRGHRVPRTGMLRGSRYATKARSPVRPPETASSCPRTAGAWRSSACSPTAGGKGATSTAAASSSNCAATAHERARPPCT